MTDSEIVDLFFSRSEKAVTALSEKYGGLCMQIAQNILGSRQDAEECVNDAYLAVWDTVPPQRPEKLKSYVCRIARNIAAKRYRANTAQKRNGGFTAALEELSLCLPSAESVEGEAEARETARRINRFLELQPKENRVLFVLRYWQGASVEELAAQNGLSRHNVSVRLSRIRKQLKEYLSKEES